MIDREQVKELVEKDFPLTKEMLFRAASICDEGGDGLVALFLRYHDRIAELEAQIEAVKREILYLRNVKVGDNAIFWTENDKLALVNVLSVADMFSRAVKEQP